MGAVVHQEKSPRKTEAKEVIVIIEVRIVVGLANFRINILCGGSEDKYLVQFGQKKGDGNRKADSKATKTQQAKEAPATHGNGILPIVIRNCTLPPLLLLVASAPRALPKPKLALALAVQIPASVQSRSFNQVLPAHVAGTAGTNALRGPRIFEREMGCGDQEELRRVRLAWVWEPSPTAGCPYTPAVASPPQQLHRRVKPAHARLLMLLLPLLQRPTVV
ncbi:hypothetical protein B0H19DRAFT_1234442 [Mycena capillaripes]|nr:hypothetical protein B0H19DRAFT_1234442 [Mycena capillaripes]